MRGDPGDLFGRLPAQGSIYLTVGADSRVQARTLAVMLVAKISA